MMNDFNGLIPDFGKVVDLAAPDDVTIELDSVAVAGWKSLRITRGIERCPSDFEFDMTERYPGEFRALSVIPGQACVVKVGADVAVTGYVDRYTPSIDAHGHTITIQGRGKCQDLIDCAAEWDGGQIPATNALQIATKLAAPYGITVSQTEGLDTSLVSATTTFNLILGETAWEIIERVCNNAAVLCYETSDGNLMLSHTGTVHAASGLAEGVNVQRVTYTLSADQRYSTYTAFRLSFDSLKDLEGGVIIHTVPDEPLPLARFPPGVKRHRLHYIIAEGGPGNEEITRRKAIWEKNRRDGRSQMVHVVTDGWRDAAGNLYEPNTKIAVHIPTLKIVNETWLIGEVTYIRDEAGTTCEMILMPPSAFLPQPEAVANGGFYMPDTVPHHNAHHHHKGHKP